MIGLPKVIEATHGGHEDGFAEWVNGRSEWMLMGELMGGAM
jgi:hypothetical protein